MEFREHNIKVTKTAQYYTKGESIETCKYLWIMCHGYGMLAENILSKMSWANKDHFMVSVEGLSKFYWKGMRQKPVASWMTKKNRLSEIEDFSNFLSAIHTKYKHQILSDTKIILFGFSQGGTTVWRWLHHANVEFDVFINYAGWVPEDIIFTPEQVQTWNSKELYMLYGDNDVYLTEDRKTALRDVVSKHGLKLNYKMFQGEHRIYSKILEDTFNTIY